MLLPIVTAALILFNCESPIEPIDVEFKNSIKPLAIGNYWIYQTYRLNLDGTIRNESHKQGNFVSSILDPSVVQSNEQVFLEGTFYPDYQDTLETFNLVTNTDSGYATHGFVNSKDTIIDFGLLAKYPAIPEDSWIKPDIMTFHNGTTYIKYLDHGDISVRCLDTSAIFITPLDTFACYVYNYKHEVIIEDYILGEDIHRYFVPGVGEVGGYVNSYDEITGDSYPFAKYVLIDYNILN